jgi:hypothetical protein
MVPRIIAERYQKLSERYRSRHWEVPDLPTGLNDAANVIYAMAARINGRQPLRVTVDSVPSRQKED